MIRATVAVLLLTLGLLAGCGEDASPRTGGDGDEPADFCGLYVEQMKSQMELDESNVEAKVRSARAWAERMRGSELPEDLPQDARRGLDRMVEKLGDLSLDASAEELENLGDDFSREARADISAMGDYALRKCADEIDEVMSGQLDGLQEQLDGMTESP